jgi:hypothetical protein
MVRSGGRQQFSSAGHIVPLFVPRGPHLGQTDPFYATEIGPRGPDVVRGPFVALCCVRLYQNLEVSVSLTSRFFFSQEKKLETNLSSSSPSQSLQTGVNPLVDV